MPREIPSKIYEKIGGKEAEKHERNDGAGGYGVREISRSIDEDTHADYKRQKG